MSKYSFKKGFRQLRIQDSAQAKAEIMEALNIISRPSWAARLNGTIEPKVGEVEAIEGVFRKYNIKKIWGA